MMVMHVDTILSPDDLSKLWAELAQDEQLPDRYELSEHGEVVMSPKPHNRHQLLCSQIAYQLQTQLGGQAGTEVAVLRACQEITCAISRPDLGQIWTERLRKSRGIAWTMLRLFRLRRVQRWPEDGMRDGKVIS